MDYLLIEHFQDVAHSRKVLSDNLKGVNKWISALITKQHILCNELQLVTQKMDRLTKERQRPLSERAKWNLRIERQQLENNLETIRSEAKDLDIVINDQLNQRQEIWRKINEVWEKQCRIWDEIRPRISM